MNAIDGFERENRGYTDRPATIPCGLKAKNNESRWCPEWLFNEDARRMHHNEDHFGIVEAPPAGTKAGEQPSDRSRTAPKSGRAHNPDSPRRDQASASPAASTPRYEIRPTGLLGCKRKVRVG